MGARTAGRTAAGRPDRPGARPQRWGPGRRSGRTRARVSCRGRHMTELPPDAGEGAPDFDAIRSPAPAAAPGQDLDPGNPAGGGPRGGAGAGLARFRAVAARLTRRDQAGAARDTGEPASEAATPVTGPNPGQPAAASAAEPAPDRDPGSAGTAPNPGRRPGAAGTAPAPPTVVPRRESAPRPASTAPTPGSVSASPASGGGPVGAALGSETVGPRPEPDPGPAEPPGT